MKNKVKINALDDTPGRLEKKLRRPKKRKIVLYVANNCFHPRFDEVAKYYSPSNKNVTFEIKKVVLGHTTII
ncbi:MAG: hypothetical protein J7J70_01890 [Deltaproteobacteria bacterium]|nr:hypothetical protein [Candidatus Tharpellaceae bacterium]